MRAAFPDGVHGIQIPETFFSASVVIVPQIAEARSRADYEAAVRLDRLWVSDSMNFIGWTPCLGFQWKGEEHVNVLESRMTKVFTKYFVVVLLWDSLQRRVETDSRDKIAWYASATYQ